MSNSSSSWTSYYLQLATLVASKSKDTSTKVGCIIVGPGNEIRSTGYNGLPRGADDDVPERNKRPEKYFWYEHAERNAIYNAARSGVSLMGSTLYCTLCPCMDCARGIIQSGIVKVVTPEIPLNGKTNQIWLDQFERVQDLFEECGVELEFV